MNPTRAPIAGEARLEAALPSQRGKLRSPAGDGKALKAWERAFYFLLAVGFALAVWHLVAVTVDRSSFPAPLDVGDAVWQNLTSSAVYEASLVTGRRVLMSFVISGFIGIAFGVAIGMSRAADYFLSPWVMVALAVPGPVYIIMSVLIFGLGEDAAMIALVASVAPYSINLVAASVRNRDDGLDVMAQTYRLGFWSRIFNVILPQASSAIVSSLRTAFTMSWKLVALVEALGRSDGIGAEMSAFFRLLEPEQILAYLVIFIVLMKVAERLIFWPIEHYTGRWR